MKKVGNIIKSLRIKEGMTQDILASRLNISRSSIGMYENGEREPSLEILENIADLFNVDMNYLTGKEDETYYYDLQARQIAQEIKDNKEICRFSAEYKIGSLGPILYYIKL